MPPPAAVAGPSTSAAAAAAAAGPATCSSSSPAPLPSKPEDSPPVVKRHIRPTYFHTLNREFQERRHEFIRDDCMRIQTRLIGKAETRPGKRKITRVENGTDVDGLANMTKNLLVLQTASAGTRMVAAGEGYRIFTLTGLKRPPEEKPRRIKLQRKERVDYQRIHLTGMPTPVAPVVVKTVERPPSQRPVATLKVPRAIPTPTPATPPVFAQPESNGTADDGSPETPPLAMSKGKRKVAQSVMIPVVITPAAEKQNSEKRPKREGNLKKRTSNRLSKTPRIMAKEEDEPTYCFCSRVSFGEMIGCDNDKCEIEWFHFECIGLTTKPKGKWFCPNCRHPDSARMPKSAGKMPAIILPKENNNGTSQKEE